MKKVLMLTTGGTIASQQSEEGLVPKTTGAQMLEIIPELAAICEVDCIDLLNLDSTNMQPEQWVTMAEAVYEQSEHFDGIVITHGTDTMAYSAAALSLMVPGIKVPVVITGSQQPIDARDTDAKRNIRDAFITAANADPGVYLEFDGRVIDGLHATKARTIGYDAFISVNYPYAGSIVDGQWKANPAYHKNHPEEQTIDTRFDHRVLVLRLVPGFEPMMLYNIKDLGYKGVILESFGPGGLPYVGRNLIPAVEQIIADGIVVAITTQSLYDGVDMTHYAVGLKALEAGVIPGGIYTCEALTIRMMIALGRGYSKEETEDFLRGPISFAERAVPLTDILLDVKH